MKKHGKTPDKEYLFSILRPYEREQVESADEWIKTNNPKWVGVQRGPLQFYWVIQAKDCEDILVNGIRSFEIAEEIIEHMQWPTMKGKTK